MKKGGAPTFEQLSILQFQDNLFLFYSTFVTHIFENWKVIFHKNNLIDKAKKGFCFYIFELGLWDDPGPELVNIELFFQLKMMGQQSFCTH